MRRSDELIKLQTKPMQLRSKQAAYEVDTEMDEGEEKITRTLPAGAVGALKAFKELQRGFPWKQKWNGKEAGAPPRKKWRPDDSWRKKDDSWWKKDANFQGGQDWRNKPAPPPPPAKKARPVQPKRLSRLSQPRLQPKRLQHVQRRPNSRETSWCRSSLRSRLHRQSHPRHCLRHHHRCQGLQRQGLQDLQDLQGRHRC